MRKGNKRGLAQYIVTFIVICLSLSACSKIFKPEAGHPAIKDINQALQTGIANNAAVNRKAEKSIPQNINNALIPDMNIQSPGKNNSQSRFNIAVNNAPAQSFFMGLVKGTTQNMVVSPGVKGNVTLNLKNVTVPEALQAAHDIYGYQFKKSSYGYQIYPRELETKMFTVNYLDVTRTGKSQTQVSSGQTTQTLNPAGSTAAAEQPATANAFSSTGDVAKNVEAASSVRTESKTNFWKDLKTTLDTIVGTNTENTTGKQVILNPDAGIVVIKAYPKDMHKVAAYLDDVQNSMSRQVIIDAKIMEVDLGAGYQQGINWTLFGANISQDSDQSFSSGNKDIDNGLQPFTNIFKMGMHYRGNSFSLVIKLLSTQGNVQILSSPRISTLNNQKAVIKVGQDEFFITNIENTTIGTGVSTQNNQDIDLTPFFSGIALDVTPEIAANGEVILHIHPMISRVRDQNKKFVVSGQQQDLPLALSTVRESDSIVRAKSGQIVVIGGLMENTTAEQTASTPFLEKIPGLGPLFRRENQQSHKSELVILLKPIVVNNGTWNKQLTKAVHGMKSVNRGFHFGSHPKIFGNLGEPTVQDILNKKKRALAEPPPPKPVKGGKVSRSTAAKGNKVSKSNTASKSSAAPKESAASKGTKVEYVK
jgi:MSHA biogenesis protein MshL